MPTECERKEAGKEILANVENRVCVERNKKNQNRKLCDGDIAQVFRKSKLSTFFFNFEVVTESLDWFILLFNLQIPIFFQV